nr:MAG TPA: Protein of unknown function (DUF3789) [Caudoviricetes sp.]
MDSIIGFIFWAFFGSMISFAVFCTVYVGGRHHRK